MRRALCAVATVALLAPAGCKEDAGVGSLTVDLSACMRVQEAGSCGKALAERYSDDVTLCIAVRTGAGDQVVPALADRQDGALSAAPGAQRLDLSAESEQATFRVFYLSPESTHAACTPEAFTVDTACTAEAGCVIATSAIRTEASGKGTTLRWGAGSDAGATCAFECGDPTFCGATGATADELCDGVDNDCDGLIDEGFQGQPDLCDELDNDCDGEVDEDSTSATEVCNGVDDDCDGQVDEGVTPPQGDGRLGEPCSGGEGACERLGVYVCDEAGAAVVCGADVEAAAAIDVCGNGLDEDCDGEVDEGEGKDVECVRGVGACLKQGVLQCNDATGLYDRCSVQAGAPAGVETCINGIDDDCNGTPDDGCDCVPGSELTCFAGAPENKGIGKCVLGRQQCNANGRLTECLGSVLPTAEVCDGLDDDCDGAVDEELGLGEVCDVGLGICAREGQQVCDPGDGATDVVCGVEPGPPAEAGETCNGLDDDCDGEIDEAPLSDAGGACSAGQGACEVDGLFVCTRDDEDAYVVVCDAQAGDPALIETCDGIDNDCDGQTDEPPHDNTGDACQAGLGECERDGRVVCDRDTDSPACDAVAADPAVIEACDGLDDTCVGAVDAGCDKDSDGFCDRTLPLPDPEAPGLACAPGDCNDIVDSGEDIHPGQEDVDNDIDDDCDDLVDEGFANLLFSNGQRADLPGAQVLSLADHDFTVEAWVRLGGVHEASAMPVLSRRDTPHVNDGYMFGITGDCQQCSRKVCRPFFMAGDGNDLTWVVDNGGANDCVFPLLRWVHIAATFDYAAGGPHAVRVYQDGVLQVEDLAFPITLPVTEQVAMIGEDAINGAFHINGKVADLRVSRGLRYPSEDPVPACLPDDADVIAHWRLSEGSGSELRDSGPDALHGTVLPLDELDERWSASAGCEADR